MQSGKSCLTLSKHHLVCCLFLLPMPIGIQWSRLPLLVVKQFKQIRIVIITIQNQQKLLLNIMDDRQLQSSELCSDPSLSLFGQSQLSQNVPWKKFILIIILLLVYAPEIISRVFTYGFMRALIIFLYYIFIEIKWILVDRPSKYLLQSLSGKFYFPKVTIDRQYLNSEI